MQKNSKQRVQGRVLARVLAEQLSAVQGGGGPLTRTMVNGHLDLTDARDADALG
jgi:hypothetical protein